MADKEKKVKITGTEKKQFGPFKKTRGNVVLTKDEVKEIREGRKKLRGDMKNSGLKGKKDFELTASSLGLYFDKNKKFAMFLWFMKNAGGWLLLGLGALSLLLLYGVSMFTEYRGHFTISMSDSLFREGFSLSDTVGFENPSSHLFCTPAENVPCISITDIPENVDELDGDHSGNYFAYTFYIRNEGESTVDYRWEMRLNAESQNLSSAAWLMVFEDGEMQFYAKPNEYNRPQRVPENDVLTESKYTADSWASMIKAYDTAKSLVNKAQSQKEIDAAAAALDSAIESLAVLPKDNNGEIDYDELISLLMRVKSLDETQYTAESWAALMAAYEAAKAIIDKAESQAQVDGFVDQFRDYLENSKRKTAKSGGTVGLDYAELRAQISRVYGDVAYVTAPLADKCKDPASQYEIIKKTDAVTYWRLVPKTFVSEAVAAEGLQTGVAPMEVHKYTVVIWLEGDDPDCTEELIGGHLGLEVYLELVE